MTSCHLPLFVALALFGLIHPSSSANTFWNNQNCNGNVTDAACCDDKHCDDFNTESSCNNQDTCLWENGACNQNRDKINNVCCQKRKGLGDDSCENLINGRCPGHFEVSKGCCQANNVLDSSVFIVQDPVNNVCCNTPCADAKALDCTAPTLCSGDNPWGRSLGGYGGRPQQTHFGFNPRYLNKLPSYGHVLPYNGFGANYHHELPGKDHASVGEVQEITVDDLLHALVEALSNDKDVFSYSSEVYSDPYFGKSKHGGPLGALNLPDPEIFLRQEYGNPYGLSSGQFGFEGKGWPGVHGVHPGSGYGYLQSKHRYGGYSPYQSSYSHGVYNPYQSSYEGYNQYSSGYSPYQQGYQSYGNRYDNSYGFSNGNQYGSQYGNQNQYGQQSVYGGQSSNYGNDYDQSSQEYSK